MCPEIWKTQGMNNDEHTREELILLNAIRDALDRRDEVFQIIDEAPDESAALARLGRLLNVEDHLCRGAQFKRLLADAYARRRGAMVECGKVEA